MFFMRFHIFAMYFIILVIVFMCFYDLCLGLMPRTASQGHWKMPLGLNLEYSNVLLAEKFRK